MAISYKSPHEESYRAAQSELAQLGNERVKITERLEWIGNRMGSLNDFLKAIVPLIEQDPGKALVDAGLTQICRDVLTKADRWVTVQEMRELLSLIGIDMSGYTNPAAVLHAILKRIAVVRDGRKGKVYAINDFIPYDLDGNFSMDDLLLDEEADVDVETLGENEGGNESSFE